MFLSPREQRLYEIRFVWIQKDVREKRGTIRTHWNADCLLEDFSGQKTTKILSTRNSSILMMSSSEYLLLESECSFTKYVSSCPNTKYLYLRLPFLKMKAFRIILIYAFSQMKRLIQIQIELSHIHAYNKIPELAQAKKGLMAFLT